jgi:cation diffusion facilitator family transporter
VKNPPEHGKEMDKENTARKLEFDQAAETRLIQRTALYGFLLNLGLAALKAVLAVLSGSLAVAASAIDSITDSMASVAIYGGLRLSTIKTQKFPLGLYKIENVISVSVAFFIFFAGYEIARQILFQEEKHPEISLAIIGFLLMAVAATWLFGRYCLKLGRQTESPTLVAEGKHRQVDVLSSLIVLAAVTLNFFNIQFQVMHLGIDQIAAVLVLLFIAMTGWELLVDGMRVLLDVSVDPQTLRQVRKIIEREPQVKQVLSLVGRNAGRFRFIQTQIILRTDDLQKAHWISDRIEYHIRKEIPHVERVMIHYEPETSSYRRIAAPLKNLEGQISEHFGEAPYFAFVDRQLGEGKSKRQDIIENPFQHVEKGKGIRVAEWLVQKKVDILLVKEDLQHKGPSYVFSNAGVEIHPTSASSLEEGLERLNQIGKK